MSSESPEVLLSEYLTVAQAANYLGVSPWTLRNWDTAGKLKPERHPVNGYRIYREEDLKEVLDSGHLLGKRKRTLTPNINWQDIGSREHFVQFYETDAYLVECVAGYLASGLLAGEAAVVFATQEHRRRISKKLSARGVDVSSARQQGQFLAFDAARTLAKLTRSGSPDHDLFREVIGATLSQLSRAWPRVRAFGEMVTLLWEEGERAAACSLESLWDDLGKNSSFSLFCAYPISEFNASADDDFFTQICSCHTRVLPAESYAALTTPEEQLREISSLQQKSKALEAEIVQRKAAEKDRALLAAIVESSDDAIVSKDLDGIIMSWNRGAERVFGYTAKEVIGRSVTILIPEDRQHEEMMILSRIRRGERIEHFETIRRRKDGKLIHASLTVSPVVDSQGQIIGASKIARDITERKKSEERLAQSEERYRRLAELLPVGVYTCEAPSGKITYYNEQAAVLWGRSPDLGDIEERFCGSHQLYLPDSHEPMPHDECPMAVALRDGRAFRNVEAIIRRPDETEITALVNIDPICDAGGRVVGAINVFNDVSALKEAEQALKEADRRKDEFLATLAHELRNPLAPIRTGLELMKFIMDDPESLEETRSTMERQTMQLIALVDDLLDMSRITRGKFELRKTDVMLADVLRTAVEASQPFIDESGHTLTLDMPKEPVALKADPHRLAQVLSNLLNNAAKYTPEGGRIRLSAQAVNWELILSVQDNGIGIPQDQLEAIFEMFTQIDRPGQTAHTGLGIGLTLVKLLVGMHGGSIRAESEGLNKGTTFTVRLPILVEAQNTEQTPAPAEQSSSSTDSYRVLVVDDNKAAALMLSLVVKRLGNEVRTAHDGQEAIQVAQEFRPDVVLMDLGMPRMNGCEAARHIRKQPWGEDITLVALTGWGQEEDKRRTLEAGFDRHIVKPAEPATLEQLFVELA